MAFSGTPLAFTLALGFLGLVCHPVSASSDGVVVFNEVQYNPAGSDESGEWIELFNQMGIITDILSVVDSTVNNVAQTGFAQTAGTVGGVITAGSALLVVLLGVNVVAQMRPMSFASFFAFGMKVALVGIFA